jgi:hypothetical protein
LNFQKNNNNVSLTFSNKINCSVCLKKVVFECYFENHPPWLFIQTYKTKAIYVNELPKLLTFKDKTYQILCATVHTKTPQHFRSIFYLNSRFYLIDDLKQKIETKIPVKKVVTCFYYLK